MVIYGTPEDVTERLQKLQEALGINQLVYEANFGCRVSLELQINSVRLMNERVAPDLNYAPASVDAGFRKFPGFVMS